MTGKQIGLFLLVVVLLVGGLVWLGSRGTVVTTAAATDPNRPVASVEEKSFDFGAMSVKDIRKHSFTIKNTGLSDLTLARVSTSCDCTYAYITVAGRRSPQQTMHGDSAWSDAVKPGESADVEVTYEPSLMPVHGPVTRTVSVTTTDPVNPTVTFTISANVAE